MRLNRSPPNITFRKKKTGGITINSMVQLTRMDEKMVQRILQAREGLLCIVVSHQSQSGLCATAAYSRSGDGAAHPAGMGGVVFALQPSWERGMHGLLRRGPGMSTCVPSTFACNPTPACLHRSTRSTTATCCSRRTAPWMT